MQKCPNCLEGIVDEDALTCPNCGFSFEEEPGSDEDKRRVLLICVILLLIMTLPATLAFFAIF